MTRQLILNMEMNEVGISWSLSKLSKWTLIPLCTLYTTVADPGLR